MIVSVIETGLNLDFSVSIMGSPEIHFWNPYVPQIYGTKDTSPSPEVWQHQHFPPACSVDLAAPDAASDGRRRVPGDPISVVRIQRP